MPMSTLLEVSLPATEVPTLVSTTISHPIKLVNPQDCTQRGCNCQCTHCPGGGGTICCGMHGRGCHTHCSG
jgi:hypothetical protein